MKKRQVIFSLILFPTRKLPKVDIQVEVITMKFSFKLNSLIILPPHANDHMITAIPFGKSLYNKKRW